MPKVKDIGSVKAAWDVIGEAYCWRSATVGGSGDVKVSLIPPMWGGAGVDVRGVADGHNRVGFTARYRRYQPHASVLHHWGSIQAGMHQLSLSLSLFVSQYHLVLFAELVSGFYVIFLFWDSNMRRSLSLLCTIVVWDIFWVWGFFLFCLSTFGILYSNQMDINWIWIMGCV